MDNKTYTIYAGVNGAGKTTLYNTIFCDKDIGERVNFDEILQANKGDLHNLKDMANAAKEAINKIDYYLDNSISFNQETTLASLKIKNNIERAKKQGLCVNMHYVGLESAELAVERVKSRVQKGGHGLPDKEIKRRYMASLTNLKIIIPMCDNVDIYDNTTTLTCIASYKNSKKIYQNQDYRCKWFERSILGIYEQMNPEL